MVYGKLDYWAKPSEILERRAGDCEDFAILKMAALLRAGIPAQSMSLVVLQDRKRGFFHEEWEHGGRAWQRIRITWKDCPRIRPDFIEMERAEGGVG